MRRSIPMKTLMLLIMLTITGVATNAATYTVTNLDDSGDGSFRKAIQDANANAGPDVINVQVIGTVNLLTTTPTITDSVIINGGSQNGFILNGGGISGVRPIYVNAAGINVSIRDLTVTGGNGTSLGGGIRVDGGSTVTLTNLTVTANSGTGAAGINVATSSNLYIFNSIISNNTVTTAGGDGGGINCTSSNLYITGTTISGNSVMTTGGSTGGGINVATSSSTPSIVSFVRVENSTVSGNTAQTGGGVYVTGGGSFKGTNLTVSGNSTNNPESAGNGGGIYFNAGSAVLRNSTISNNTANNTGAGGGIYSTGVGNYLIANTIVANNTAETAASAEIRISTTSGSVFNSRGNNVIEGTRSGTLTIVNGAVIAGVDPQLGALSDNGGKVKTHAPQTGSNTIDAAMDAETLDTLEQPIGIDGRGPGYGRRAGASIDIGAFETGITAILNPTANDLDGDGRADIAVYRPSEGNHYKLVSGANNVFAYEQWGLSTDILAPADYDGDGITDTAVFRDGTWYIAAAASGQVIIDYFGMAGDLPRPGDFDGDGRADIAVYRPSDGTWYYLKSSDRDFVALPLGTSGDVPVFGDYDADGKDDPGVFTSANGTWHVFHSSTSSVQNDQFGLNGDIPVLGDFNGDNRSDLAVYRPSSGYWYYARPTGVPAQNFESMKFGLATDVPVAADYDGDGKTDVAVYRPSEGMWYIYRSTAGMQFAQFGTSTDKPIPAAFHP